MADRFPQPEHPIDALVRTHLEAEQSALATERILGRIKENFLHGRSRSSVGRVLVPLGLAASLLFVLLLALPVTPIRANPTALIRHAQQQHAQPADRCYHVVFHATAPHALPFFAVQHDGHLWTRGDRFYMEPTVGVRGTWGRDPQQRVWLVTNEDVGLRYEPHELPPAIQLACEVRAVQLDRLLATVLRDCELTWSDNDSSASKGVRNIVATPNKKDETLPRPLELLRAEIAVDTHDHLVRHMVLRRRLLGQEQLTITMTLVETKPLEERHYQLESHLRPDAVILDHQQPLPRGKRLAEFLGGMPFRKP